MTAEEATDKARYEALRAVVETKLNELEQVLKQLRDDTRRITEDRHGRSET